MTRFSFYAKLCQVFQRLFLSKASIPSPMNRHKADSHDWNSQLPYSLEENWLLSIKQDLACTLQSSNYIGITEVTSNLKLYLELKLEINSNDLAWFADIFYNIVTESNSNTSTSFCDLFVQITQDEDDLPSDSLELDWKPLYNIIFKYLFPPHGRSYPSSASHLASIIKLTRSANRFGFIHKLFIYGFLGFSNQILLEKSYWKFFLPLIFMIVLIFVHTLDYLHYSFLSIVYHYNQTGNRLKNFTGYRFWCIFGIAAGILQR